MAEVEQEINLSEETSSFHESDDQEHEDLELPKGIWEEIHELVEKVVSKVQKKMHLENLLKEKPDDSEDKTIISTWLDKLINLVRKDSDDTVSYSSRELDNDDAVTKLERFKVKNLAGGSATTKEEKKK